MKNKAPMTHLVEEASVMLFTGLNYSGMDVLFGMHINKKLIGF